MKNIIFFVIISFITLKTFACDCTFTISSWELRQLSYSKSIKVVMVRINKVNEENYEISTLESFKGSEIIKTQTISILNSCSMIPKSGEIWILYISEEDDKLYVDECYSNRKLPFKSNLDKPPAPSEHESINGIYRILRTVSENEELSWLRSQKLYQETTNRQIAQPKSYNFQLNIIMGLISIGLILIIFILLKVYKQGAPYIR